LSTTRHRCNLDVWALAQSCGDGHRLLVTPESWGLNEYNEDLIFLVLYLLKNMNCVVLTSLLLSYAIQLGHNIFLSNE